MSKKILCCSVCGHRATVISAPTITSGSVNVDKLYVKFDLTWGFDPPVSFFVAFYQSSPEDSIAVQLTEFKQGYYTCIIPSEFLEKSGSFHFAIFAKNPSGTIIKTSTVCNVKVLPGAFSGAPVQIDWQGFYNQLVGVLNENFSAELATDADLETVLDFVRKIEDGGELWKWIIWLLNTTQIVVDEDMTREEVQNVVSEYSNNINAQLFDFREFINTVREAVKTIIPDFVEPDDFNFAAAEYARAIKEYAEAHVPKIELDAAQNEVISLQDNNQEAIDLLFNYFTS